jgi:DNA replication protein DnaC
VHPEKPSPYLKVLTSPYFKTSYKNYHFQNVYEGSSTHQQIFEECGKELCEAFIKGKNCNIIVYGPTSTGKTYSMQGNIHQRVKEASVKYLFDEISKNQ